MLFNENDLIKYEWDYQFRFENTNTIPIGTKVFLKSNPEVPLVITSIKNDEYVCLILSTGHFHSFLPQMLMTYEYASCMIWKQKYFINLN